LPSCRPILQPRACASVLQDVIVENVGAARADRLIKAVEVDIPGCSFNPDLEQHQDAVAEAVAAEMTKIYAREHMPKSKKLFNHMPAVDELETLLV
jgi:hypothetical protein